MAAFPKDVEFSVVEKKDLDQLNAEVEQLKEENQNLRVDRHKMFNCPCVNHDNVVVDELQELEQLRAENEAQKKELKSYKAMEAFKEFSESVAKMAKKLNGLKEGKKEKEFEKGGFIPAGCCGPSGHTGEVILTPEQLNELRTKCLEETNAYLRKENEMLKETIREHIDI